MATLTYPRITLEVTPYGYDLICTDDFCPYNSTVQMDWDYPSTAETFGWTPCDECSYTDGTVDCEHRTASEMISDAANYLDAHDGAEADCGY